MRQSLLENGIEVGLLSVQSHEIVHCVGGHVHLIHGRIRLVIILGDLLFLMRRQVGEGVKVGFFGRTGRLARPSSLDFHAGNAMCQGSFASQKELVVM